MRLQKFLSLAEVASRRASEELILSGKVKVNGKTVDTLGTQVEMSDTVKVNGKIVKIQRKKVYIMLNKPKGYITSVKDEFDRKTVLELTKDLNYRLYPVGRLDYNTSGLIFLTNDGDFANRIIHPKSEISKTYIVKIRGFLTESDVKKLESGIEIEGSMTAPAKVTVEKIFDKNSLVKIVITEGRNRQVRKMCESLNHEVLNLQRVAIGSVKLGNLPVGKWRHLKTEEIKSFTGA